MFRYDALNIAGTRLIMSTLFRFNVHVFIALESIHSIYSDQLQVSSYRLQAIISVVCVVVKRVHLQCERKKNNGVLLF